MKGAVARRTSKYFMTRQKKPSLRISNHIPACHDNRCLKKYCDCFNTGVKCDPDRCRCTDCLNYATDEEDICQDDYDDEELEFRLDGEDAVDDDMEFEQLSNVKREDPNYHHDFGFTMSSTRSTRQSKSLKFHEDVTAV